MGVNQTSRRQVQTAAEEAIALANDCLEKTKALDLTLANDRALRAQGFKAVVDEHVKVLNRIAELERDRDRLQLKLTAVENRGLRGAFLFVKWLFTPERAR
jgi:hypothetical protein